MKKTVVKILGVVFFFFAASVFNNVYAQQNTIQEIKVSNADGFAELRSLILTNFDFNNPDYQDGIVNSNIKFDVAADGEITNVKATGDCKFVAKELENIMNGLLYKVNVDHLKSEPTKFSYIMPVRLMIATR